MYLLVLEQKEIILRLKNCRYKWNQGYSSWYGYSVYPYPWWVWCQPHWPIPYPCRTLLMMNCHMMTHTIITMCYTLNQGRKDRKHTLGPITWLGSDVQTRQGRLSASRELQLQPTKVVPLAPKCSWISGHLDTKSQRTQEDWFRGKQRSDEGEVKQW